MAIERGLDISGHQLPTNTTLLGLLAQPLYTFVICKATEGVGLEDSKYVLHRANSAKYGKRHGAYHFAWPNQDPIAEAAHFARVGAWPLPPVPTELRDLIDPDLHDWASRNPEDHTGPVPDPPP